MSSFFILFINTNKITKQHYTSFS